MEEIIEKAQKLLEQNKPLEADDLLRQALKNYGDKALGKYASQLYALRGVCAFQMTNMENAVKSYWFAAQTAKVLKNQLEYFSNYLFCLHYSEIFSPEEITQYSKLYGEMCYKENLSCKHITVKGKIKIAYLSNDFRTHAAADFVMPFFKNYDNNYFEVHAYCLNNINDKYTEIFKKCNLHWHDVSKMAVGEIAEKIRAEKIDILVDLGGHSGGGSGLMIMSYRPALVQISGIGWLSTTGCDFVDYYLTDEICSKGFEELFTEKLLKLKNCFLCYQPQKKFPEINWQPKEIITFGVFSNFDKITNKQLILWEKILQEIPEARLILKDTTEISTRRQAMQERISSFGIENVEVRSASDDYLNQYNEIDIALDTYPYAGGATLCESLYMGVPMICRCGSSHSRNVAVSILYNCNHQELLAENEDDYVKKAISLANNQKMLINYHFKLRRDMKNSLLMNSDEYMKQLEDYFKKMMKSI